MCHPIDPSQAAFFWPSDKPLTYWPGFQWLGVAIMCVAGVGVPFIHFPPWGSMFLGPTEGVDEVSQAYR